MFHLEKLSPMRWPAGGGGGGAGLGTEPLLLQRLTGLD